ncbi:hypothetical protein BV20DRAFT_147388 [Pilatotrama ljubarskyi]|nr:hypothetical protein BV20DRAFT_147388 [Pilatotrama ljubarskyi]
MPDLSTAMVSAGAKPLVKIILTFRPGKFKKKAAVAERQVTKLLFDGTAFIGEREFAKLMRRRAEVDAARLKASTSSWRRNGFRHIRITYRYYTSATTLLQRTEEITDKAMRHNGPEGQRASRGAHQPSDTASAQAVPVTSGSITSLTIDNVLLRPGDNLVRIPCPDNVPHVASIVIRMRAQDAEPASGRSGPADADSPAEGGDSLSITISPFSDSESSTTDEDEDQAEEEDSDNDVSIEASIRLTRRTGKERCDDNGEFGPSIEIDVTEADDVPDCENC